MPYCIGATELYYPLESFEKPILALELSLGATRRRSSIYLSVAANDTSYFLSRVHNSTNPEGRVNIAGAAFVAVSL